jgi:tetratricopeptide (TPR) repeat protein
MINGGHQDESPIQPSSLDEKSAFEWRRLSMQTMQTRLEPRCSSINDTLEVAASREPQSPAAPLYRTWIADNLARDGRLAEAIAGYDAAIRAAESARPLFHGVDGVATGLGDKAQAAMLAGDRDLAIATYRDLAERLRGDPNPLFLAGLLADRARQDDVAFELYGKVAAKEPSNRTDDPAERARRALLRLEKPADAFTTDPRRLADSLTNALARRDWQALERMVSRTHFAAGAVGGHTLFETQDLRDGLYRDLKDSSVTARRTLLGYGDKLYLQTSGWAGRWYRGDVIFLLTRAPKGWEWTGVAITTANQMWLDRWRPAVKEKNQPLPFELAAPWPSGQCFKAGGFAEYLVEQAAVLAAGWPWELILLASLASSKCGFGPRGFYFNLFTHTGNDAFAIDFTRYRRFVPYDNESGGTPVLAARGGVVTNRAWMFSAGDPDHANFVVIDHADPANPTGPPKFRTRYLHLDGPDKVPVSVGMNVALGTRLGLMDDTGNSVLDHLHFSIHDVATGASIRPTPMAGSRLEDGDSNTCVCSRTIEPLPEEPMLEVTNFAGQNWLITPAASAVNETPPRRIEDQIWLLVLTGVAMATVKGESGAQWKHQTVSMRPSLLGPLQYAINTYGIPIPQGAALTFQVEQWAPFASLSSIFNQDHSVNSGFAVDLWRPNPFNSATHAVTDAPVDRLFEGIQVDVAVRDTDAYIFRLGYSITLLGRIVPTKVVIL